MVKTRALLGVAAVLLLVAGCSGGDYDEAAHRTAMNEAVGHRLADGDWATIRDEGQRACGKEEARFSYHVAMAMDADLLDVLRTNVTYLCPDRLAEIEKAVQGIRSVDFACDLPPAERTESQARIAEAMGC